MSKKTIVNLEEALANYCINSAEIEDIRQYLNEEIEDLETYNSKKSKLMKKLAFLSKAIDNKERDSSLLILAEKLKTGFARGEEKPLQIIKEIFFGKPVAYYRNLTQLSNEQILELVEEKNLVKLLEELENNDQNKPSST